MNIPTRSAAAACLTLLVAGCASSAKTAPVAHAAPAKAASAASVTKVTATTEKTIALPGKGGHGDVVVADPSAHAVYVAQSPDDNLVVLDTTTNKVKAVVPDVASANGIVYTSQYVFVAEATGNAVAVVSKSDWKVVATVSSGGKTPDALYYDSRDNSVFVANDDSNNMEEFSATKPFTVEGSFGLKPSPAVSGPDLGVYVPAQDRIYQSDDNDVLSIDAKTRRIQKVFSLPLAKGVAAKDMYYDQSGHLLWVATNGPDLMALNPDSGKVVYTVKTASGADQVAEDTDQGLLLLGEGNAGVMAVIDLATHRDVANIKEETTFHTLDHLPNSDLVYAYLNKSNVVAVEKLAVTR
jgi:YVTN family beta-propeller protein